MQHTSIIKYLTFPLRRNKIYDKVARIIIDCDECSTYWQNNFDFLCEYKNYSKESTTTIICDIVGHS